MQRAPVMPNGWPIEIEPPLTFSFVGDASLSRLQAPATAKPRSAPQVDVVDLRPALQRARDGENRAAHRRVSQPATVQP